MWAQFAGYCYRSKEVVKDLATKTGKGEARKTKSVVHDTAEIIDFKKRKPHIVFVLSDNSGWADYSWNDETGIMITPNMERLARGGVILDQTYVQPICTPTRGGFMTGRYPFKLGLQHGIILPPQASYLRRNETTLAEQLKQRGYATHIVGKWHLGACREDVTPTFRGFDTHYGPIHGYIDYYTHDISVSDPETRLHGEEPNEVALDFFDNTGAVFHKVGTHASDLIADRAVNIIKRHRPDTPMFLFMSHLLPHFPFQAPDRFLSLYKETNVTGLREYRAMVTMLDDTVGRLVQALKERGMWEDTLLIYLNDNGGPFGFGANWPFRGAINTPFEGGVRTPGFIHGSMVEKTRYRNNELIHITDFFPTLINLAGGNIDPGLQLDGMDVWETLSKGKPSPRKGMIIHYDNHPVSPGLAVRNGDYKLIDGWYDVLKNVSFRFDDMDTDRWYPKPEMLHPDIPNVPVAPKGGTLLFNIKDDPRETNDLSAAMPDKVNELRKYAEVITAGAPPAFYPDRTPEVADPNSVANKGIWIPNWC
ncbi:arylsulfatase B-like [Glandiceps talaboti]